MIAKAIPKPEDVEGILNSPFIVMYWPMMIGTVLFVLLLGRGHAWIAIPVGAIAIAVQANRLGVFS